MLDSHLAALYGVTTRRLNEQVKRNRSRFPADFMFRLTAREVTALKSQFATSNVGRGGRRKIPNAFTEHGALMLATVLNSPVAVQASIAVVRAFLRLRTVLAAHSQLAHKLEELEQRVTPPPPPAPSRPIPLRHAHVRSCLPSGSARTRFPVASKIALQSAGITGGSAGSPNPVGGKSVVRKVTSTGGAWGSRSSG